MDDMFNSINKFFIDNRDNPCYLSNQSNVMPDLIPPSSDNPLYIADWVPERKIETPPAVRNRLDSLTEGYRLTGHDFTPYDFNVPSPVSEYGGSTATFDLERMVISDMFSIN